MSELMQQTAAMERTVGVVTHEIKMLHNQMNQMLTNCIVEIGRRLVEVKAMLPHGEWGEYLKTQVEYSQSTANNFMKIFEKYGASQMTIFGAEPNSQALGNLPYTKALALLAVPSEELESFIEENDVENLSTRELTAVIRERDEEKKKAETARAKLEAAEARAEESRKEIEELQSRLEELRSAPVDVAVETVADADAIKAARADAKEKAEKKLKADIDRAAKDKEAAEQAKQKAEQALAALKVSQEETSAIVEKERQAMAEQVQTLQKKLAVASSSEMVIFKLHFEQGQASMNRMSECIEKMTDAGDAEGAEKLKAALMALLRTTLEVLEG